MAQNPIYVGLDTPDIEHAERLARAVKPYVGGLKLGLEFFMANGPGGVRRMGRVGLPIFLDLKLHDIPNTVSGALKSLSVLDLAIVNVHAGGGLRMMQAAEAVRPPGAKLIAVTVLTSMDEADLSGIGVFGNPAAQVRRLAALTREAGLDGVVCSAHEVAELKAQWANGLFVVPGIRPAGAELGDQKRVMSPAEALAAGATLLVIGRPITAAQDPASAAAAIADTL
ncbi:orotidine-5'-phosphate decarboxylase [Sandaracinobacter sp. RS1-74]|uniref:orotidine-5'-phosphate decarboxylase n=1 Tax=Sandaracinobacteroides sayramensis TaxID=2913411 RepID=UPI001EDBF234|nr:orotidine-5'-phosphate decarboxylase [Sandaracinobacteroides sayramensis]